MKKILIALAAVISLSVVTESADARGGRSSFSSRSYSSRTYSAPRPAYKAPPARTVVVQKNVTNVTQINRVQQSSGGGFLSSFGGAVAGSAIGSWLFNDKPAPQQVPVDCSTEANKPLPVCQPK